MQFMMDRTYMLRAMSFVLLYVAFTKAALLLALDGGFATVVWPGSGLALSLLLIYGNNMWPAITVGAFLVNFLQGDSLGAASLMSIGNTLEALIAFNIIKAYGDLSLIFIKLKNVINFILASLAGSLISAAVGSTTILLFSNSDIMYVETFTTWWLGDVTSCLLIVPVVVLMNKANLLLLQNKRFGLSFLLLIAASGMVFLKKYDDDVIPKVLVYSMIIFPLSAALGQNRLSAMLHVFVISVFAIWGTINEKGPFIYSELNDSLIILQSFTVILLIVTLIVSVGIKEKEMIEDRLSNLLSEKELLISEIHHRVKNNLAVVSSLLFLEREHVHSEEIRQKMDQTQLRIKTIALVHDKLNLKLNIKTVEFSDYVKTLTEMIQRLNETENLPVDLVLNMEKADVDIDKAVPLGLILNELLTNSFKHAFRGKQSGTIEISFSSKANKFFMLVKDNGVGYKAGAAVNSGSLGLKLINSLAYQINADVAVNSREGTRVEFSFN